SGQAAILPSTMAVFRTGAAITLEATAPTHLVLLGGAPLDGPRYIWWNFVSSDKDRIIDAAHRWRDGKFPKVPGDDVEFIPAPDEDPHFAQAYHPPTDDELRTILTTYKTIAMVGASSDPAKPSHRIMKQLLAAGYHVIPVNPQETEVLGQRAFASLSAIEEKVDIVDVFRKSEDTPPIADEAKKIGAKVLWLQLGISSDEAASRAIAGGLTVVMNTCIGATHARLGL
ncbi:MAG TPA: CoA-binding protein, partial [Kofleriaceae bacterium]|nr:CoA-binding protein [Kofleriaceae bacterium]